MKRLLFSVIALFAAAPALMAAPPDIAGLRAKQQQLPLLFTENKGQVTDKRGEARPDILFTIHNGSANVYLTATGIHYQFTHTVYPEGYQPDFHKVKDPALQAKLQMQAQTGTDHFTLSLAGANPHPHIRKEEKSNYFENFYLPQCPQGITGVATYSRLVYEDVYPGIDWIIYSNGNGMKYDFVVKPGADPDLIKLKVSDAESGITKDGSLELRSQLGTVTEAPPVSYTGSNKVVTSFIATGSDTYSFQVGDRDKTQPLRIDPSITWATFYGGNDQDFGQGCTTDTTGNVYLTGYTRSATGIAMNGFQNGAYAAGFERDAFIVKFDAGGARLWATYYGDQNDDIGYACATDHAGNVFMAGTTAGADVIASINGYQINSGGLNDAFLVKFTTAGTRVWGTYYGGSDIDYAQGCMADAAGNIYMCGYTNSGNNIASPGFQNSNGGAFLAKFDTDGSRLWGTYCYGRSGQSLSMDMAGDIYMAGYAGAYAGIIAVNGFPFTYTDAAPDDYQAVLAKFDNAGNSIWFSALGTAGTNGAVATGCAADSSGNVYVTGYTTATTSIATPGAYQETYGGDFNSYGDAFLAKYSGSNGTLTWATYYGSFNSDMGYACTTDGAANVYMTGATGNAGFLTKFSDSGNKLWEEQYSKGFGHGCAYDRRGNVYVAGEATGVAFPAQNGFQNTYGGGSDDGFLVKTKDYSVIITAMPGPLCAGSVASIPYYTNDAFTPGNVFILELSDASGSFATPVTIGSVSATTTGYITATIPAGSLYGTGYKLRISSSAPVDTFTTYAGLTITTLPTAPTITASGPLSFCAGGSVTLSTPTIANVTYSWLRNDTVINGATTSSYTAATTGIYKVAISNLCGTTASAPNTVTVNSIDNPGNIQGPSAPCTGTTATYYILNAAGATSYNWTLPAGWAGNSTDTSISVTVGSTGGTISVTAGNTNTGCVSGISTGTVTVSQIPAMPAAITGNTVVCSNSSQTYSIGAVTDASSYTWTLPAGWSSAGTGTGITSTAGNNSGTISVTANNTCGASAAQMLSVTVNPIYNTSFYDTICQGTVAVFAGNFYNMTGSYPHTFTSASGCDSIATLHLYVYTAYTNTVTASTCEGTPYNFGGITCTTSGSYSHNFTSTGGCDSVVILNLTVNPLPAPVIIFQSPLLSATVGYNSYQWLYNGTMNIGTNADTLTAQQNGTYTVTATDAGGCTGTSAVYTVTGLGISNATFGNSVKIYPNPANDVLYIEQATNQEATLTVTDITGKVLISRPRATFRKQQLDISRLSPGLYLLRLTGAAGDSAGFKFTRQ